jgi:hypothetical protein
MNGSFSRRVTVWSREGEKVKLEGPFRSTGQKQGTKQGAAGHYTLLLGSLTLSCSAKSSRLVLPSYYCR